MFLTRRLRITQTANELSFDSFLTNFASTEFYEVAGYQCDFTVAWRRVGALVLGLASVGVLAAGLDSLP